ncbi:L-type lectin-domain containing receptor kinase IX.1-like [Vigna unguiculata]|uniref:L-type lectin-domain containing receptor kinase IX.1-like n=1 Tax=Vigna unguiculata TaxID=3917 RepID=UPI00101621F0|nr:L-type lectin-domain containing receptor kinase IX.1-like [Vigna unguiculata]
MLNNKTSIINYNSRSTYPNQNHICGIPFSIAPNIISPVMAASCYCKKSYVHAFFHVTLTLLLLVTPHAASLEFNYQQVGYTVNDFIFSGDVKAQEGILQLTIPKPDSYGRVVYNKLLHLWDKSSGKVADFTTQFYFTINAGNETKPGDGITFFLADPKFPDSEIDGSGIGLASRTQLRTKNYAKDYPFVAVEFDTMANDWDPKYDHVGIDVNAINTTHTTEWYTSMDERGYDAEITFESASNRLSATFTGYKNNSKFEQTLFAVVNLSDILPEWVEFGFSSATGYTYEEHTLSSWSFNSSLEIEQDKGGSKRGLVIGLSVGLGVGVLIALLGVAFLVRWMLRTRGREDVSLFDHAMDNDFEKVSVPKKFSHEELARATNNFATENKIGQGGFGAVYRGFIRELNTYVAIKKVSRGSRQGVKEYMSEVKIFGQLRHKNLVQLFGWCHQHEDLLLIYEFMENGSLDSYLFKGKGLLTWKVRYNIARGLASALLYLHEEWEECVLHRDIKSSNVMLDSNFNTKLGDFGLARLMDHGTGSKTTGLAGTIGYLPPEATTRGKASRESDVFSFGVVALEIACGRKAIESNMKEEQIYLVDWVLELHSIGEVLKASDPSLYGHFDEKEMETLMIVGLWCTHTEYLQRPTIRQVVQMLNFEAPLPILTQRGSVYNASFSSMASRTHAFANNQPLSSTSSSSVFTGSSQSTTTLEIITPTAAHLHTY